MEEIKKIISDNYNLGVTTILDRLIKLMETKGMKSISIEDLKILHEVFLKDSK